MYLLFKSVYVETDRRRREGYNFVDFSTTTGYRYSHPDGAPWIGDQLAYGQTLEDLTPFEFGKLMYRLINSNEKTYIYSDSKNYSRMFSIWIKALFPTVTLEQFKFFFLNMQAMFEVHRMLYSIKEYDVTETLCFDLARVIELYEMDDIYVAPMRRVIRTQHNDEFLSLEWRLIKLITENDMGSIPGQLKHMIRRAVIGYGRMALEEWANIVTNPDMWEYAGTTLDKLLENPTTPSACSNIGALGDAIFNTAECYSAEVDNAWMMAVLDKCIETYERAGRTTHINRISRLRDFVNPDFVFDTPEKCLEFIDSVFGHNRNSIQLAYADTCKYNPPLIRWLLRQDKATLTALKEDAKW